MGLLGGFVDQWMGSWLVCLLVGWFVALLLCWLVVVVVVVAFVVVVVFVVVVAFVVDVAFIVVVAFVVVSVVVVVGAGVVSWLPDLRMDCDVMGQKMIGYTLAGPSTNLRLMLYLCKYWTEPASSMFEGGAVVWRASLLKNLAGSGFM